MNNLSSSCPNFNVFPSDNISCLEMGFIIQPQFFDIRSGFFSIPLRHTNFLSSNIGFRTNFVFKNTSWFYHDNTEKQTLNSFLLDLSNLSPPVQTSNSTSLTSAKQKGFNKGDKVSATPTPKDASHPSHHPNIKLNSTIK